jgi:RNA polymerase sigma-54 factor
MKQGLQFKFSQQLSMTPQLQQAIKLLQLSTLELQQEVQQALEDNPLLELEDSDAEGETSAADDNDFDAWDDPYSAALSASGQSVGDDSPLYQGETHTSLHDHLLWQMRLSHFTERDEVIAEMIIDSIDENGYLQADIAELIDALSSELDDLEADEVAVVLKRIQQFEPTGVGARSISECLQIQLRAAREVCPDLQRLALQAVQHHLDLLAGRDYRSLIRRLRVTEPQLAQIIELIQSLAPRPGDDFAVTQDDYVIPDILVRKKNSRWIAELNRQSVPKLKVNATYLALADSSSEREDIQYIRQQTQDAKWFIRSLDSRNDTLLKVAQSIVQRQQGFFEFGPEAMKPMILADIAATVDMHESTISRITTQKYMHTPRGVFELKYFFSSQLATDNGGECSSTAIRALLKKLVAAENPKKPLSDSQLTELMADQGIQVARRTIAKYREALNIAPSSQRKRLI